MHDRALHDALSDLALEAAHRLDAALEDGAELDFELMETGRNDGSAPPLYCYRPRTDRFIGDRFDELALMPGYAPAVRLLERRPGTGAYLRARGHSRVPGGPRERADAALRTFLEHVWEDATDFHADPDRFARAYESLERALYAGRTLTCIAVEVEGLTLRSPELSMADGLTLVRADTLHDAPEDFDPDATIALVRDERRPDDGPALEDAARTLRRLQSALRLWDEAAPALAAVAHMRSDGGSWIPAPLAAGTRQSSSATVLAHGDEDPFRAFCALVSRRVPRGGTLAWALRRYELGLERPSALEALSDHLLAARALLEPEGPHAELLADRLAAICAPPEQRDELADRLDEAIALERGVMHGTARADAAAIALVDELAACVRAVLRDVLCGHLDRDVRSLADRILLTAESHDPQPTAH